MGALRPPTTARLRPSDETDRPSSSSPPSTSPPVSATRSAIGAVVGHEPAALDPRLLRAGPHGAGVGARAEQQAERGHDHRLAGAGLTGDGREAGAERQGGLGDHPEVADAELLNQRAALNHGPPALAIR